MGFKHWMMIIGFYFLCVQMVESQITPPIKCPSNHYAKKGVGCTPCGKCLSEKCGAQTGACIGDCSGGFKGQNCDIECEKGRYGRNCESQCNTTCLNNDCNSVTGICNGCDIGYVGRYCEQECSPGTYGWKCDGSCRSCLNNDCDPKTGHCVRCPIGYIGEKCTVECPAGTHGEQCSYICPHCSGLQCNKTTGQCLNGCDHGYYGDKCELESRSFTHGLMYGSIPFAGAAVVIIIGVLIFCCHRRHTHRRKSHESLLTLQRIQRRVGGYTACPLQGVKVDKLDNKTDGSFPPESPSPSEKWRPLGSFRDTKNRMEPEGSQLPDDVGIDGRKSGYIDVKRKSEVMTEDGYLMVDLQRSPEENYENISASNAKLPMTDSEEIYENSDPTVIVPRVDSQPLYENFGTLK